MPGARSDFDRVNAHMRDAHPGATLSGPAVERFTSGWALPHFNSVAHFYTRHELGPCKPICERAPEQRAGELMERGDFPKCSFCARIRRRQERRGG